MSKLLFDDDAGSDDETGFKTNKDFAKSYNKYRQKELLKKLKDKDAGNESDSSSDSDSSEDDESAFNPKFDEVFLKTLSSLKRKDPSIYEKSTTFFDDEINETNTRGEEPKKKAKKLTVKEYEQNILLKNGGAFDEESNDGTSDQNDKRPQSPSYNDEQILIKEELVGKLGAIGESDDDDDGEENFGGLFSKREKTKKEQDDDDNEQEKWLSEQSELKEKAINEIWSNQKLSKDDKFLRDYILSNGYADKDDEEIPTYDEIVGDDEFEEKQTEFEQKYNFRFEDPDQEFIKRYPRTIENSVRKVDTRRKEKRVERRERKEVEKKEKFQEIEMLKELKRKEIEEKIEQLKAVTGTEEFNIDDIDLDGDFDPDEHDKKMQAIFNSEYYQVDEGDEKPEAPSDIEDLQVENYDEMDKKDYGGGGGAHCEEDDFNMDCDYDEEQQKKNFQDEMIESTRSKRKRKRKSKFMEMLEQKRPAFDPEDEKTFGEYLDEYYKLDCEDIIGDVKCRFKYVETVPCDYGLTVEEILGAKNKELNAWASLKKATQIRPEHVERNDQMIFERKARNEMLKKKILQSLYEPSDDEAEEEDIHNPQVVVSNRPLTRIGNSGNNDGESSTRQETQDKKKKKNKNNKSNLNKSAEASTSAAEASTSAAVPNDKEAVEELKKESTSEKPQKELKPKPIQQKSTSETSSQKSKPEAPKESSEKPKVVPQKSEQPKIVQQKTKQLKIVQQKSKQVKLLKKSIDKFKAKHDNPLKKVAHKTIDKKNRHNQQNKQNSVGLSDERLKAFGINPKKFKKKQKYGTQSNQQNSGNSNNKSNAQLKHNLKIKNKLKKVLKK